LKNPLKYLALWQVVSIPYELKELQFSATLTDYNVAVGRILMWQLAQFCYDTWPIFLYHPSLPPDNHHPTSQHQHTATGYMIP
jgi:hypothetical protein